MTESYKLGWINATIRKVTDTCYQLTIAYPVKVVQRFKSRQECVDILVRLDKARRGETA